MSRSRKTWLGMIIVGAITMIVISKAGDTRACPHIPCETGLCMYDPVIDNTTCFHAEIISGPCKCEEPGHRCTPWYRKVVASRIELVTGQEDGTPPPCAWDGPCYQCFRLNTLIPCSVVYKCRNWYQEGIEKCNPVSLYEECGTWYSRTNHTSGFELTGQICCYWIQ